MEMKKDIFISYRNDGVGSNFAARITSDLRNSGYSVYFNPDEARSDDFPERLKQAIESCKDFICIVTETYISQLKQNDKICWVRDELLYAKKIGKNIVPLLINGAVMPRDVLELPEELQFFPHIDAYTFPEQYLKSPYEMLCSVLRSRDDGENGYRDAYNLSPNFHPDDALRDILITAKAGNVKAMLTAGIYYYYGISGGKNEKEAAYWFKKVSGTKEEYASIANRFIARMYYSGSMPREPQSYKKSYEYHAKSEKEDVYSATQVGFMQTIGSGCDFDYNKTENYFSSILDSLDSSHKNILADFYFEHGDFLKAAEIYREIAETYPKAAYQLGLMYKRGVLCTPFMPDYEKAAMYLQKALDNGFMNAAFELGMLYFNPTGTFKKDFVKAQKYFEIEAMKGNTEAQYMLGYMYNYGHVERNLQLSIKYFEMSAKQGHVWSAAYLALLYQNPELHNYEKAFKYCQYAADCGDTASEFVLGTLYLYGRGCEPDENKAYICFRHAAENGSPEAQLFLKQIEE